MTEEHFGWMRYALNEAEKALMEDEVPVGAVVVRRGKIIGRGYNRVEGLKDPTAHAEIIAITAASSYINSKWLVDSSLYVTLEPCAMCAGAIILARLKNLIIGTSDPKAGACGSVIDIVNDKRFNHRVSLFTRILEEECSSLLKDFFKKMRNKKDYI
ncbi:MAG: nucleoside deaminase [Candidatus Helarchaeota archaeon]|nr:nucleoside deaminase [Candidatus Helarchaeota archaeon]